MSSDDALVERVAAVIAKENGDPYDELTEAWKRRYLKLAPAAIAAVREHDAGMPCGHCTPGQDEIRCACRIEARS